MTSRGIKAATIAAAGTLWMSGCSEQRGFDAPNPSRRLDAIVDASAQDADPATLLRLVEQLDSQDPAARMLAIRALEKRTGETLGYVHTDPEWARQEAVERWIKYLEQGGSVMDLPSSAGGQPGENPMDS